MESLNAIFNRVPKTERPPSYVQTDPLMRLNKAEHKGRGSYMTIISVFDAVKSKLSLSAADAYNNWSEVLNARHDIWYESLVANVKNPWVAMERESKFGALCEKLRITSTVDQSKTPDLMIYNRLAKSIIVGDVTVTVDQQLAVVEKYKRYAAIRKELTLNGWEVIHIDFVLKEDGSNLDDVLRPFLEKVLTSEYDPSDDKNMTESANRLLKHIREKCDDSVMFELLKDKNQMDRFKMAKEYTLLGSLYDERLTKIDLTYKAKLKEIDIIKMIKQETDRYSLDEYFNTKVEEIKKAFDDVRRGNDEREEKLAIPKSSLKVCDNSQGYENLVDHDLIMDYLIDICGGEETVVQEYILHIMPTMPQVESMKIAKSEKMDFDRIKSDTRVNSSNIVGYYQYKRVKSTCNEIITKFEQVILKGKGENKNIKKVPKVIDMSLLSQYASSMEDSFDYYGSLSNKPPILDDSWLSANKEELDNTKLDKELYDYCRHTNGAQLGHALSSLYNRITHLSARLGKADNVYVPPNGSFIALMPCNHAPVMNKNCDMPFIFICRTPIGKPIKHIEYEYRYVGKQYIYYVSKLCRLNLRVITCWQNAGYRIVASSSYLLRRCTSLIDSKKKVIGLITALTVDIHQKVSEYLDTLKYTSFMPFAELHKLPELVRDKCNLLMKTRFDAWMLVNLERYCVTLSDVDSIKADKPFISVVDGKITKDSLGIEMELPSFINTRVRHKKPSEFIEEIKLVYTCRPKHLYGSQFLDESTTKTAEWNLEYDEECNKFGGWAINGYDNTPFPFDSKFCYSADAIHYATILFMEKVGTGDRKIMNQLSKSAYSDYLHNNCSLRGCTKEPKDRGNTSDLHTTSIQACFEVYEQVGTNDRDCRALTIGQKFIANPSNRMEFSMSEKDQRGGGRPIATPTIGTKAALMLIEKPEAVIGTFTRNNILVAGKNKLKEQYERYISCLSDGVHSGRKNVYQLTEDQTKYSENDNPRKYEAYIKSNKLLDAEVRSIQLHALRMLYDRTHLVKRMPVRIQESRLLSNESVVDDCHIGVRARIGWPQGMLNNISTSVHSAADYWIYYAFTVAYPNMPIVAKGLVHSDDSWVTVCCDDVETFKKFTLFRILAKKLFCLKLNTKKLWGGKYLGEIVSNYNLNGHVHLSTATVICNGLSNLTYINWPIDVSNQISTLQQAYRSGATVGNLIMIATVLKQQTLLAYNVSGKQLELLNKLPVELGGYPQGSVFRLAVCGISSHYSDVQRCLLDTAHNNSNKEVYDIIVGAATISKSAYAYERNILMSGNEKDEDYVAIELPDKGEIFKGIRHLMPRSKKLNYTMKYLDKFLEGYPILGIAQLVPRPDNIYESLSVFKETVRSKLYSLAAEHYTHSARRLAISQTMQSKGNVIKLYCTERMTFNQLYEHLKSLSKRQEDMMDVIRAFEDQTELSVTCNSIVQTATFEQIGPKHGAVINRMPECDNIYNTTTSLRDVLLYILDMKTRDPYNIKRGTNYYTRYGSNRTDITTVDNDAGMILKRFDPYFKHHNYNDACKIIMQGYMSCLKSRLWIQPRLNTNSLCTFLEDLYGATINQEHTYRVKSDRSSITGRGVNEEIVQTVYSCLVLNNIYANKFPITGIDDKSVNDVINNVDTKNFNYNTLLKYGICQYLINKNPDYLTNTINSEEFVYEWKETQKYEMGRWQGDWKIEFSYRKMIGSISCNAGMTTLITNIRDAKLTMSAMRLLVSRCFSMYSYNYDTWWGNCQLWCRNKVPYDKSRYQYLIWHSPYESKISGIPPGDIPFLNILVDEHLKLTDVSRMFERTKEFELGSGLRVIKGAQTNPDGTKSFLRMASVFQDFSIPMYRHCKMRHEWIDGFLNIDLIRSGVMEDITLSRPISVTRKTILGLLERNNRRSVVTVAHKVFERYMKFVPGTGFDNMVLPDEESHDMVVDTEHYEVSYKPIDEVIEVAVNTEVESLEAITRDMQISEVRLTGKLRKSGNLLRTLCVEFMRIYNQDAYQDFIYTICKSTRAFIRFQRLSEEPGSLEKLLEDSKGEMVSFGTGDLFFYLYGLKLDLATTWNSVDKSRMYPIYRDTRNIATFEPYVQRFLDVIEDISFYDTTKEVRNTALDYMNLR